MATVRLHSKCATAADVALYLQPMTEAYALSAPSLYLLSLAYKYGTEDPGAYATGPEANVGFGVLRHVGLLMSWLRQRKTL